MRFKQGNQVRGALRVKFMFNSDWYDNWITLHVNLILKLIDMLNRVISCVDYFKSDWHAQYGMIT